MHTETFVETFDATFGDIPPNAAVTFNDDTTMGTDAPLISVFVDAAVLDGDYEGDDNTTIPLMYTIEQRENQASFAALESYFGEPDGETSVEFESCSLFIDSVPAMSRVRWGCAANLLNFNYLTFHFIILFSPFYAPWYSFHYSAIWLMVKRTPSSQRRRKTTCGLLLLIVVIAVLLN